MTRSWRSGRDNESGGELNPKLNSIREDSLPHPLRENDSYFATVALF